MRARAKIRHRGDRWYLSVVDAAGVERAHGGFRTQREAKLKARELLGDVDANRYVAPDELSVREYLERWLATRQAADLSPGTRELERIVVASYIAPHVGAVPLQDLGTEHLARLYATLARSGGRGGKPLRGKTVRNVHGVLSKALGDATRWSPKPLLATNPAARVEPPARDDSVRREAWSVEEVRTFLRSTASDRLAPIWRLALATGLRRGELLGLTWDDVDGATITVRRQIQAGFRVRQTTKSRRARTVRIDEATTTALRVWKARQAEERLAFGPAYRLHGGVGIEAPWVVTEPDGYVVNPDTLLRRWRAAVKRAGVKPIPLHGARHTHAELSLAAGTRLDVVSRQLGHASIAITANVYGHPGDQALEQAAERLGGILGESNADRGSS
jgi:integrase